MTPTSFALVLLLTYLAHWLINVTLSPKPERQPLIAIVLFLVFVVWVIGVPIIIARK